MTCVVLILVALGQAPAASTIHSTAAEQRGMAGRVVGLGGRPVAGVTILRSGDFSDGPGTVTDADGRFKLDRGASRPTFLFARKSGYRLGGLVVAPDSLDVTLTIHKVDEPPVVVRKVIPPLLPRAEEVALARRVVDPYAELVLKSGGEAEKIRTLEALARIEPERVLELIGKKVFNQPFFNSMLSLRVAGGLMEDSIDEALAVLEGMEDPGAKALGYLKASTKLAGKDRAKAITLLDQALLHARRAKEPDGMSLLLIGRVAETFLDFGQTERGTEILRQGETVAKQLPKAGWVGYARGAFAEELAQIDLDAALDLTKDLADAREFDRHHGNIAHELGGRNPAEAERVLAMVKDGFQREQYAVRVVYRMAAADLPRAVRLAGSLTDQSLKGYALGMMALGLAEADNASAREVLESAFDVLERLPHQGESRSSMFKVAPVAAALLPVAERIEPGLVEQYLWRSLAMRPPKAREPNPDDMGDVQLAMMLARYDRAIARSLIEPVTGENRPTGRYRSMRGELYAAAAAIDPKWAVALVEKLGDDADLQIHGTKNSARLAVAAVLGRVGNQRHRKLESGYLYLWLPDVEDYDSDD